MPDRPKGEQLELPLLIDIPTLAKHLGVGERHIRRLVFENRIPYVKWGHLIRFDQSEIIGWLKAQRRGDGPGASAVAVGH